MLRLHDYDIISPAILSGLILGNNSEQLDIHPGALSFSNARFWLTDTVSLLCFSKSAP